MPVGDRTGRIPTGVLGLSGTPAARDVVLITRGCGLAGVLGATGSRCLGRNCVFEAAGTECLTTFVCAGAAD